MPDRQSIDGGDLIPIQGTMSDRSRFNELVLAIVTALRQRLWLLSGISLGIFLIGLAVIWQITPRYEAVAQLRIDPSRNPIATARDATTGLSDEAIDTQVSMIASPEIARRVVEQLKLAGDPEFALAPDDSSSEMGGGAQLNAVSTKVLTKLSVGRQKLTYIINIAFQSHNPVTAQRVANAFAENYIKWGVGGRTSTAQTEAAYYSREAEKLAAEVRDADARLAQYRAGAGIVEGGQNGTITDQQIAPLSTQLAEARSQAAEANAKLAQAQRQIQLGGLDSVSSVRSSLVIGDLRRQLAEVTRELGEVSSRYGEKHPEAIKVRQQIVQLNKQIEDEANRAIGSLRADADAANARAASLASAMGELKGQQASNTRASVIAEGLEREATNKRAAYDRLAQMRLESLQSARNDISSAEIVSSAQLPLRPTAPNKPLLAALVFCLALVSGVAVVAVVELLATGLRSLADVERWLKLPLLASLPRTGGRNKSFPADMLIEQPASLFGEGLRNARASILGFDTNSHNQVIAFTSALPEEGKTTTALSFARVLAMGGTKTLLIDCDLRKAALLDQTGQRPSQGLVEVLRGESTIDAAIVADRVPGLDLLLLRERQFSVEGLFSGSRIRPLLQELRRSYPIILLDLPPVMGVADARELAAIADGVAFIVRWNTTPVRAANAALSWLRKDNANILGAILTIVDPHAEAAGGLFYSSKYASYYQMT